MSCQPHAKRTSWCTNHCRLSAPSRTWRHATPWWQGSHLTTESSRKHPVSASASLCFFLIQLVGGGVHLGPIDTAATDLPIVACPGWLWRWRILWNEDWQGKPKYSKKTHPSATLSTTNPTWPDPGKNPGRRGGKPATNRLSYGVALLCDLYEWVIYKYYIKIILLILHRNENMLKFWLTTR
jgi:hypothetical protein